MNPRKIAFVTGLTAEAALLRGTPFMSAAGGGTPEGAAAAAQTLLDQGAKTLISFGLAGGLDPGLPPGAIIIPRAVLDDAQLYECAPHLTAWLGGPTAETMLGGAAIAVTTADKSALFTGTNAAAIDLESGALARIAARQKIPFAVLRAVCDPAGRDLPPAALVALNSAGGIAILRILASLLRHPSQLPGLLGLARDAAAARSALSEKLRALA
jgi:adenosylhomocysteine nucleosidase